MSGQLEEFLKENDCVPPFLSSAANLSFWLLCFHTGELNAGQFGHFLLPRCNVVDVELTQLSMPAGTGHHLHELDRRLQEAGQLLGGFLDVQFRSEVFLLGGDTGWAVVCIADTSGNTSNGLHR